MSLAFIASLGATAADAQNPVQWSGSVEQSVARANEQMLPLLFWVTGDDDDDDDDLDDAQEECFRDRVVVDLIHDHFVPVRVSRTSRVIDEARKLGLPTSHGLYCAVLTADGRLLDQMGPGEIVDPAAFASHLASAYSRYCDDLYERELQPIFENPDSPKSKLRLAAQTVWRLHIRRADADVIGLLARPDLTPSQRSRLYTLLASLGTEKCINTLLDRTDDTAAGAALQRADPASIEGLLAAMPGEDGPVTPRQLLAYRATTQVCRLPSAKPSQWWDEAPPADRRAEIDRVTAKAQAVTDYWKQSEGLP